MLGAHRVEDGFVVRAWHPDAVGAKFVPARGATRAFESLGGGLFGLHLAGRKRVHRYRVRFEFDDGSTWERDDPYRFAETLDERDLALFTEGRHRRLWQMLGAHLVKHGGVEGTRFAVWAPHAVAAHVVGDFCAWDGRLLPMRSMGASGVWELFVPGVEPGAAYKFELLTAERQIRLKTDPFARRMDPPPHAASRVVRDERFVWNDRAWMKRRRRTDLTRAPVSIYEVHLGSWMRRESDPEAFLDYRELAPLLIAHAQRFGFTHLELLPVAEHAFYGSWGYQCTGYYAPTWRYGTADDLRAFVDACHRAGIGVLLDWVPAHFPKDDFALRRFDGRALFEVDDPVAAEHPDWGTLMFDFGKPEVRNFLIANALYWLREFHIDGLRVDAVSWLLYLDYGRRSGEWMPNRRGGREHLEGIELLQELNRLIETEAPGAITVAEEATAYRGVTAPVADDGLGFTFKWNMGWMNDTLGYFQIDPARRSQFQERLTFAMQYEANERFVNALSHDEVVHLKRSLLGKMPGDEWQRFANLRLLLAYQFARPGKKLLFMGSELAPDTEWNHDVGLDWSLAEDPSRRELAEFYKELGAIYLRRACLWRSDPDPEGFAWIDASDHENSVMSFVRRNGDDHLVVVFNFTPVPRDAYRIGVPAVGTYAVLLDSDDPVFGGSGYRDAAELETEDEEFWGWKQSVVVDLPPLAALVLTPSSVKKVQQPPEGAVQYGV